MLDPTTRWGYRLQRIWLTPFFRALLRTGLPCLILGAGLLAYLSQPDVRLRMAEAVVDARDWVQGRPEFMVQLLAIEGAETGVAEMVRAEMQLDLPLSSFDIDLEPLRQRVEALPPVKNATLRIRPGGVLEVGILERRPALVWRKATGLALLDVEGVRVGTLNARSERGDLPLVVGAGADRVVHEALDLVRAGAPMARRMRGLRRVGERRWDVVLDRGQIIQLPETGAVAALERVILLDSAQELLARDITVVDLRNPRRPTLRLAEGSLEELRKIRGMELGVNVNE